MAWLQIAKRADEVQAGDLLVTPEGDFIDNRVYDAKREQNKFLISYGPTSSKQTWIVLMPHELVSTWRWFDAS